MINHINYPSKAFEVMNNNESEKWRFLLAYICSIEESDKILIAKKQKKCSHASMSNTIRRPGTRTIFLI